MEYRRLAADRAILKQHFGPAPDDCAPPACRFCVVTSLHDGMNLVAKEFVASRNDEDGALVLSRFTGAARELNRRHTGESVLYRGDLPLGIGEAIEMPRDERMRRMQRMREEVETNNIYRWAGKFLSAQTKFEFPEGAGVIE